MFTRFKKKESERRVKNLRAFVSGKVIPIEEVPDPVFSEKILGGGVAIEPNESLIVAPCDAVVSVVADTKHAIGLTSEDGLEILIHEGLETVTMDGAGFKVFVEAGQKVKAGDKLISFDKELIKEKGCATVCVMAISNEAVVGNLSYHTGMDAKHAETIISTYEID